MQRATVVWQTFVRVNRLADGLVTGLARAPTGRPTRGRPTTLLYPLGPNTPKTTIR